MTSVTAIAVASFVFAGNVLAGQAQPAPETTAQADEADNGDLAEIVVTATKRATNLQQTPISISVLSANNLKDRRVQSLLDLADGGVPSLRVATFEARQTALTIGQPVCRITLIGQELLECPTQSRIIFNYKYSHASDFTLEGDSVFEYEIKRDIGQRVVGVTVLGIRPEFRAPHGIQGSLVQRVNT